MTAPALPQTESRERVLNAAYGLFLQSGLTAVSMQQIADEAGITKATLYHHFRDKQDLYLATMRLAITSNERALHESLAGSTNLRDLVRELIGYIFGDVRADLQRLATDFKLHIDRDVQHQFWSQYQRPWHLVQSAVEGIDGIDREEATQISRFVYGASSGLSQLYRYEADTKHVEDAVLDQLADTIVYGLRAGQTTNR